MSGNISPRTWRRNLHPSGWRGCQQEAFASKADLDAAMIRNAKGIFKWQEGDTELVDPRDPDITYDMPTTAEEAAEIISEFDDDRAVYLS